jgi:hypothetical protein
MLEMVEEPAPSQSCTVSVPSMSCVSFSDKEQGLEESTGVTTPTKANLSSDASMPSPTWALVLVVASGVTVF